jgi:hypothetical protein
VRPEQFTNKTSELLCKDLFANPCREMLAGGLCPPLSKHFKRKILQDAVFPDSIPFPEQ